MIHHGSSTLVIFKEKLIGRLRKLDENEKLNLSKQEQIGKIFELFDLDG